MENHGRDWRECCAMASGWLTRAYHGVSLETDFSKSYQHNFLVYCIRKSEDLQDFRSECLLAQAALNTRTRQQKSKMENHGRDWRECCAMASGWLTRAYHGVSLETDFSKSYQHNFLVYCIVSLKTYKILGPSVSSRKPRSTLEPGML